MGKNDSTHAWVSSGTGPGVVDHCARCGVYKRSRLRPCKPNRIRWGYSRHEEPDRWEGACMTRDEAVSEGASEYEDEGCVFFVQSGRVPDPAGWINVEMVADRIIDDMLDNAGDNCGEVAEDFDVSKEARDELARALVKVTTDWARKYATPTFWMSDGTKPERIEPSPPVNAEAERIIARRGTRHG